MKVKAEKVGDPNGRINNLLYDMQAPQLASEIHRELHSIKTLPPPPQLSPTTCLDKHVYPLPLPSYTPPSIFHRLPSPSNPFHPPIFILPSVPSILSHLPPPFPHSAHSLSTPMQTVTFLHFHPLTCLHCVLALFLLSFTPTSPPLSSHPPLSPSLFTCFHFYIRPLFSIHLLTSVRITCPCLPVPSPFTPVRLHPLLFISITPVFCLPVFLLHLHFSPLYPPSSPSIHLHPHLFIVTPSLFTNTHTHLSPPGHLFTCTSSIIKHLDSIKVTILMNTRNDTHSPAPPTPVHAHT